jgi:hypothetical protein
LIKPAELRKIRRKFGFNKDRDGLITRYLGEQKNWQSHLENTKSYILNSVPPANKKLCLILGSGWLLDIPIDDLCRMFDKVILADISHPAQIKHKFLHHEKIEFVNTEITSVLGSILGRNHRSKPLSEIEFEGRPFGHELEFEPDFVISANILSQLSFFPKDYLQKVDIDTTEEIREFSRMIEQNHIARLPKERSCLIADHYQYVYDKKDKLVSEKSRILTDLPENETNKEWIWDFDLSGRYKVNKKVRFKVSAQRV